MAALPPISGLTSLKNGATTTLTNAQAGGTWTSSDTSVLTVNSSTGVVTAISVGSASIIYTVNTDSIAVTVNVYAASMTNGFDLSRVFPAFQGRLGWHDSAETAVPRLSTANKQATSGRYYDRGIHKAVTLANYFYSQEDPAISESDFNQLLQDEDQAVIMRCMNAVFNKPQLIEHKSNYIRTANIRNTIIPNGNNAAGYRINVAAGNYAVVINNVSLLFNGDVTFPLYLFNDLKKPPVYTKQVSAVANTQTVVNLEWVMNYINTNGDTNSHIGGVWYLLYFQSDLGSVRAIDEQMNMWQDTRIFGAFPFQAPQIGSTVDFNRINPSVNFRSYGLNLEMSSYRDYTQKIVENPQLFDEARLLTMAINVIEQVKFSTRSEGTIRNIQPLVANVELEMQRPGASDHFSYASNLKKQLEREFKRLNDTFWPEQQAQSVSIGADNWLDYNYEGMDIRSMPARNLPQ